MRGVVQRVQSARVTVAGDVIGEIGAGLLVLLGVGQDDAELDAQWLAEKICALRIFEDSDGRMNHSVVDLAGEILVVSQFTLLASTRKGSRPSFNAAAKPDVAMALYEAFNRFAAVALGRPVSTGQFAARMEVALVNDGPVTIVMDSKLRE